MKGGDDRLTDLPLQESLSKRKDLVQCRPLAEQDANTGGLDPLWEQGWRGPGLSVPPRAGQGPGLPRPDRSPGDARAAIRTPARSRVM